jgi:hypothetical protein
MELTALIYYSTAKINFNDEKLVQLLNQSRENNIKYEITGLLLHCSGTFMQFIEGPKKNVHDLMDRISQDPRHTSIAYPYAKEIKKRLFPNWLMGFKDASVENIESLPGYAKYVISNGTQADDELDIVLELLKEFVNNCNINVTFE